MRNRIQTLLCALFLLLLTSCSGQTGEVGVHPSETPSAQRVPAVTAKSLLKRTPVPAMCGHKAGVLINGSRPATDPGFGDASLLKSTLTLGDLTGDGIDDGALVGYCTAGGVDWGAIIFAYTMSVHSTPILLGDVQTKDVTGSGIEAGGTRPTVKSLTYHDGHLEARMMTQMKNDAACCGTLPVDLTMQVEKGRFRLTKVATHLDQGTAQQALNNADVSDPFSDVKTPQAVSWGLMSAEVNEIVREYVERVIDPQIDRCYKSRAEVRWTPSEGQEMPANPTGTISWCVVHSATSPGELLMVMERKSPSSWVVAAAEQGSRR